MPSSAGTGRRLSEAVLSFFALLLIVLMVAIGLQVLGSFLGINPLVTFRSTLPLLGDAVTLNALLDLQWHLLVIVALLPASLVWLRDRHVRVDFLYATLSPRSRAAVDLVGNLAFAAPFLILATPAALDFARRAWLADEESASGGLNDLWLVKGVLPLGLAALGLAIAWESVLLLRRILRG